ncbi:MAG: ABC transporter substrate-binding protein [Phycisphaeraceae bacterium]|nr:ABC transporter substrate-binding protein [Phycisphaeraceae bacterium]
MWHALASGDATVAAKAESLGLSHVSFRLIPEDVQALNRRAIERGDLDITAISAHAYPHVRVRYQVTRSGASFGEGYGPKVVVAQGSPCTALGDALGRARRIIVPGVHTTAFLTLQILAGRAIDAVEAPFLEIAGQVAGDPESIGLLIHEAQVDVEALGVREITDLGAAWRARTGLPLPLGLNVVRRDLDRHGPGFTDRVARLLGASVARAVGDHGRAALVLASRSAERPEWADPLLVGRYLAMYVNGRTMDMGGDGLEALGRLLGEGEALGLCPAPGEIDLAG